MINYHQDLVSALKTVTPNVVYEMALTSKTKTPCISYMELNNYVVADGDVQGYSMLTYQIKVWSTDIAVLQDYALKIDNVLRPLGWTRISSGELYDNQSSMIQKIMTYEALGFEVF